EPGRTVMRHATGAHRGGQAPDQANAPTGRGRRSPADKSSQRHEASLKKGHARDHRPTAQHHSPGRAENPHSLMSSQRIRSLLALMCVTVPSPALPEMAAKDRPAGPPGTLSESGHGKAA